MSASLVGSEMCIRDRDHPGRARVRQSAGSPATARGHSLRPQVGQAAGGLAGHTEARRHPHCR
eukprot:4740339-Alexandrium_andersonii.AAC.1